MKIPVLLKARTGAVSTGEVEVKAWTKNERLLRALKFGGITWGIALVCVVLPIVHFILVPLFLIAGPLMALRTFRTTSVVLGGRGHCPFCQKDVTIGRGADHWPIDELCTQCQNNFSVVKATSQSA